MTKAKEAAQAASLGKKTFLPTQRCSKHPDSEFYVSSRSCISCESERNRVSSNATHWAANKDAINASRKLKYNKKAAKKLVAKLIAKGISEAEAIADAAYKYQIDVEELKNATT